MCSDFQHSDEVRSFIVPNIERISLPEQSNGIYYVTALNIHQEAVELGICVWWFSAQYVVGLCWCKLADRTHLMPWVKGKIKHIELKYWENINIFYNSEFSHELPQSGLYELHWNLCECVMWPYVDKCRLFEICKQIYFTQHMNLKKVNQSVMWLLWIIEGGWWCLSLVGWWWSIFSNLTFFPLNFLKSRFNIHPQILSTVIYRSIRKIW